MNRRTAATLILLAWVSALGWLVQRHYLSAPRESDTPRWPVPPGSAFHALRIGGRQYGIASMAIDTVPEGLRVVELTTIDLPPTQPGVPRRTSARTEALYSRGLQLRRWSTRLLTELGRSSSEGVVSGDTLLRVVSSGEGESPETLLVRLRRPVVLPSAIPLVAASRGLPRTGSRLNVETYDALDHELRVEHLTVAAESLFTVPDSAEFNPSIKRWTAVHTDTVRAWRLERLEHGLPILQWIDASGMTVRLQHPLGAVLDRSAFELVNSNFRALPIPAWDTTAAAPSYTVREGTTEPAKRLVVLARLMPPGALPKVLPALDEGWQSRRGDTLEVTALSAADSAPEAAVLAAPLLGTDDPGLARAAALTAGRERDPARVVQALSDWVRRSIRPRVGSGTWSAVRAFGARSGTPGERIRVLVALARSAGMEGRTVSGLVRVNGRWQLREWAEIWTGTWTPADPADPGALPSTARIRLWTGGNARQFDLALRAGRLYLDVLEETR